MKKNSIGGPMRWLGALLLALFCLVLWLLLRPIRLIEMHIISNIGKDVYNLLLAIGFNPVIASYITSQAAHETGNFTSDIFKSNNNLFGFKYVTQGINNGEQNGYANYKDIEQSVADFTRYFHLKGFSNITSLDVYVYKLKAVQYFEAPLAEYQKGCNYFYNLYFKNG